MTVCIALLCRNEAGRYLESALAAFSAFADVIVALDDGSTDGTPALLKAVPKVAYFRWDGPQAWGAEAAPRQTLFQLARQVETDWIFVLDADMVPLCDPRPAMLTGLQALAFPLYDLWGTNPLVYREDLFWQAHKHPRFWAVRNPGPDFEAQWPERGIHVGHFPTNVLPEGMRFGCMPLDWGILHYAYADPSDREAKYHQYMRVASTLQMNERLHAESITDSNPIVLPLPYDPQWPLKRSESSQAQSSAKSRKSSKPS